MAKKKPYRFVLYLAARTVAAGICLLPRGIALACARFFGRMAFGLVRRQRNRILENLRRVYGRQKSEAEIKKLASGVFVHAAQTAVEVLQFPKLTAEKINAFIDMGDVVGRIESLRREGKGLITMTAHIGNWELLAAALCLKGVPMTVTARRIYYEPYNRWIVKIRSAVKMRMFYRGQSAKGLLGCLKRNEVIGILPDQDIDSLAGIYVDFFGRPAYTPVSPVKLALKMRVPILTGFLIREPGDRYRFVLGEVIRPMVETTEEEAVRKYTAQWMKNFEQIIRQYPEQWVWMHDRWKTQASPSPVSSREKGTRVSL